MTISTPFRFATAATFDNVDETNLNRLVDSGGTNLLANPLFLGVDDNDRPQFWKYTGTVGAEATTQETAGNAVSLAASAEIRQDVYGILEEGIRSQELAFRVRIHQAAVDDVEVSLDYGVSSETPVTEGTETGAFVDITGTVTVPAGATKCELVIENVGAATAYVDRAQLVAGPQDRGWLYAPIHASAICEGRADATGGSLAWEALPGPRLVIVSNDHSGFSGGTDQVDNQFPTGASDYWPTGTGYYNASGGDECLSFPEFDIPDTNANAGKLTEVISALMTTGAWRSAIRIGAGFSWSVDTVTVTGIGFIWPLGPTPPARRAWPRA